MKAKRPGKQQATPTRPFRVWNANEKHFVRWRCYKYVRNAHNSVLLECRWAKIETALEVLDIRSGKRLGTYLRRINDIAFTEGD